MADERLSGLVRASTVPGTLLEYVGPRDQCASCHRKFAVGDEITLVTTERFVTLCYTMLDENQKASPCWYAFVAKHADPPNQLVRFVGRPS